ncbi:MAG: Ppx/GppA phosphatase family protein [Steroidobacteraceae bacterium]
MARTQTAPQVLAAVDLGSNSFHLIVARNEDDRLVVVDRLREMVRLGAGINADGSIDREAAARAIACLERFGQRLREFKAGTVRVVGTNALRHAHRKKGFLNRAREALGHPIQIISGSEEARLIYSGVAHSVPQHSGRTLVVDIGGGSTELIIGAGFEPLVLESTQMGCVSFAQRFFPNGRITAKRMRRARLAARLELQPVEAEFVRTGWERAFGSSGTVLAIAETLVELGIAGSGISSDGLESLQRSLITAGRADALAATAISRERAPVFAAGVAVLAGIFEVLAVREMQVASGALRDGLLYDIIGRYRHEDARELSVRAMQSQYRVDVAQAARVEATALRLYAQVAGPWQLGDEFAQQLLSWAARLHEIGLAVSHSKYHQHGAYLLEHSDMPGFARDEQRLLARLVATHRRKMVLGGFDDLLPPWDERAIFLVVLLRLAVLLHRSRSDQPLPALALQPRSNGMELRFPANWLRENPLTVADLSREITQMRALGFRLKVFTRRGAPLESAA